MTSRRIPALLLALPALALVRWLAPETGGGLYLRLALATLVVLLPGRLVARALGRRSGAGTISWTLAAIAAALAITFAVRGSLSLTLWLLLAAGLVALPFALRKAEEPAPAFRVAVALAGIGLGLALWHVAGIVHGDELFHLGRVRKLDELGGLSLRSLDEFRDGGLHPGYAFPLWHAFLALVARLGGADPAAVVLHEGSVLAPLAVLLWFEAGLSAFRSAGLGLGVAAAAVAQIALAPGGGGAYATLSNPGTAARQLLVPAVLAAFVAFVRAPSVSLGLTLAAGSMDLAWVHPTYALFVLFPLAGFAVVRVALARVDARSLAAALGAVAVPAGLVFLWIAPLVRQTASHDPSAAERVRSSIQYAGQLEVFSAHRYRLAPEMIARGGAVAVAALLCVPLAALAARRRWAALVLGGSLAVLVLELTPWLFPRFSDLVSLSQARRAAGFLPFAFALAGGAAVLARLLGPAVLALALGAGIWLELAYPGDFALHLGGGGPAWATWTALVGGAAALGVALVLARRRTPLERTGFLPAAAVLLFVTPVAVHGFAHWSSPASRDRDALTPGLVRALRTQVPPRSVVFADLATSYRISAYAPVYVAAAPPTHVADTTANRPYERRRAVLAFFTGSRPGRLGIPRRYGAGWIVVRRSERLPLPLPRVYRDSRFTLYRLPSA